MVRDNDTQLKTLDEWGRNYQGELSNLEALEIDRLVTIAQEVGAFLARGEYRDNQRRPSPKKMNLKMNQIRRFLDAIRRIDSERKGRNDFSQTRDGVTLLRPKLAYAAGREQEVKPLMNVLDPAIKSAAVSPGNFEKLLRLVEGIVAYHRFHGGSN